MGLSLSTLYSWAFGGGEYKVVMVGLDNAGKTSILYRLHLGEVIDTNPTVGSNVEEVVHRNVRFQVWDLGGQAKLRRVWTTYYVGAHAVVLVIDSTDRERLTLVRDELAAITENEVRAEPRRTRAARLSLPPGLTLVGRATRPSAQELRRAVLLVLANKQDLDGAMTPVEITQQLKLHLNKEHSWQIQPCSALTGSGLFEGMDWVAHTLRTKR